MCGIATSACLVLIRCQSGILYVRVTARQRCPFLQKSQLSSYAYQKLCIYSNIQTWVACSMTTCPGFRQPEFKLFSQ